MAVVRIKNVLLSTVTSESVILCMSDHICLMSYQILVWSDICPNVEKY